MKIPGIILYCIIFWNTLYYMIKKKKEKLKNVDCHDDKYSRNINRVSLSLMSGSLYETIFQSPIILETCNKEMHSRVYRNICRVLSAEKLRLRHWRAEKSILCSASHRNNCANNSFFIVLFFFFLFFLFFFFSHYNFSVHCVSDSV